MISAANDNCQDDRNNFINANTNNNILNANSDNKFTNGLNNNFINANKNDNLINANKTNNLNSLTTNANKSNSIDKSAFNQVYNTSINTVQLENCFAFDLLKCASCECVLGTIGVTLFLSVACWIRLCGGGGGEQTTATSGHRCHHRLCVPFSLNRSVQSEMVDEKYCNGNGAGVMAPNHALLHHQHHHSHHHQQHHQHVYNRNYNGANSATPAGVAATHVNGGNNSFRHLYANGKNGICKNSYEIKRPSSVSSGGSGDSGKDLDTALLLRDDFDLLGTVDTDSDYEYGPGIVDRLRHKFMALSCQQQQQQTSQPPMPNLALVKRCSSMEELALRTTLLLPAKNVSIPAPLKPATKHQQINGTKKKILNHLNSHSKAPPVPNLRTKPKVANKSTISQRPPPPTPPQAASPKTGLYPQNIVKQYIKNHQQNGANNHHQNDHRSSMFAQDTTTTRATSHIGSQYLLLGAPMPYIKRSKSVETISMNNLCTTGGTFHNGDMFGDIEHFKQTANQCDVVSTNGEQKQQLADNSVVLNTTVDVANQLSPPDTAKCDDTTNTSTTESSLSSCSTSPSLELDSNNKTNEDHFGKCSTECLESSMTNKTTTTCTTGIQSPPAPPSQPPPPPATINHQWHAPIRDSEMPKPDIVKTVKRLFETNGDGVSGGGGVNTSVGNILVKSSLPKSKSDDSHTNGTIGQRCVGGGGGNGGSANDNKSAHINQVSECEKKTGVRSTANRHDRSTHQRFRKFSLLTKNRIQ